MGFPGNHLRDTEPPTEPNRPLNRRVATQGLAESFSRTCFVRKSITCQSPTLAISVPSRSYRGNAMGPTENHPLNVLCRLQRGEYVSSQVQVKVGRWNGKITELPYTTGVWGTSDMTWVVLPFWKCQSPRCVSHIFRAPVISSWIGLTPSSTNPKTSVAIDENVKPSTSTTSPTCFLYCTP